MKIKYCRKSDLKDLMDRRTWSKLDDELKYPIAKHMLHNDNSVRVWIVIPGYGIGNVCSMTVPIQFFNELPEHEMEDRHGDD